MLGKTIENGAKIQTVVAYGNSFKPSFQKAN